jgi:hypothetical protein
MRIQRYPGPCAAVLAASLSASYAGVCSDEIDALQARIDAKVEATTAAGSPPTAGGVEGPNSVQPTPRSTAGAQERLGELQPEIVQSVADANGDKVACERALAEVRRTLGK